MVLRTFGGGPADILTDASGSVVGGVEVRVYTHPNGGQRVTALFDVNDQPLPALVSEPSGDDKGRIAFKAEDSYSILYLDSGRGLRWAVPAREVFDGVQAAIQRADDAYGNAQDALAESGTARSESREALNRVNSQIGLDVTALTAEYVAQMRIDPARSMQSFAKDPITGQFYVAQALANEDMKIYRCSADGRVMGESICLGGGHGSSITIESSGSDVFLWFWWTQDKTGNESPRCVRWRYTEGVTVSRTDPNVLNVPDFNEGVYTTFAIDQAANRIATMTRSGNEERFTLHRFTDYKAGINEPIAVVGPLVFDSDNPYQGHTTIDGYLYVHRGNMATGTNPTITRYEWGTETYDNIDTHKYGLNSKGESPGDFNEAEGCAIWRSSNGTPSLLIGKNVGGAGRRQGLIYAFNPPLGDNLSGETLRRGDQKLLSGITTIVPEANKPTVKHVSFEWEFENVPAITVSAYTSVIGTSVAGVSYQNATTTGFDIYLYRINTNETNVSWIAVGG